MYHPESATFVALVATIGDSFKVPNLSAFADWTQWEKRNQIRLIKPKGFSLVPSVVFDVENLDSYLNLNGIDFSDKAHLTFDEVALEKAIMVFNHQNTGINSSNYSQLINQLSALQSQNHRDFLHLQIDIDGIFIAAFKNGKLQLANQFSFKAKEDILYYLAAVANTVDLSLENDLVTYSGYLRPKTELKKLLNQYIGNLKPVSIANLIKFDTAINPLHQVYYTDVFILPLCAL